MRKNINVFSKLKVIAKLLMTSKKIFPSFLSVITITAGKIKATPIASKKVKIKTNKNIKNILILLSKTKSLNMFFVNSKIDNFDNLYLL